jgi:GNAT superfamily N-acetyltransferase
MNTAVSVRAARIADAGEIARLATELGYPSTSKEITSRLSALLADSKHFVAVAEKEGSILSGWIAADKRMSLESGERAEIVGLVVSVIERRAGVGRALVGSAERWAGSQGLRSIWVRSNIAREESHLFYRRMGYIHQKTQHTYAKEFLSIGSDAT